MITDTKGVIYSLLRPWERPSGGSLKSKTPRLFSEFFYLESCTSLRTRIKNQLRTAEQGDRLPTGFVRYLRIPNLGGAAVVDTGRKAGQRPFADGTQKVALEFDGSEILRPFGQAGEGPVAAGGIGDGDDHGSVQISVGGQQLRAQREAAGGPSRLDAGKFDPDQARQGPLAAGVHLVEDCGGRHGRRV